MTIGAAYGMAAASVRRQRPATDNRHAAAHPYLSLPDHIQVSCSMRAPLRMAALVYRDSAASRGLDSTRRAAVATQTASSRCEIILLRLPTTHGLNRQSTRPTAECNTLSLALHCQKPANLAAAAADAALAWLPKPLRGIAGCSAAAVPLAACGGGRPSGDSVGGCSTTVSPLPAAAEAPWAVPAAASDSEDRISQDVVMSSAAWGDDVTASVEDSPPFADASEAPPGAAAVEDASGTELRCTSLGPSCGTEAARAVSTEPAESAADTPAALAASASSFQPAQQASCSFFNPKGVREHNALCNDIHAKWLSQVQLP